MQLMVECMIFGGGAPEDRGPGGLQAPLLPAPPPSFRQLPAGSSAAAPASALPTCDVQRMNPRACVMFATRILPHLYNTEKCFIPTGLGGCIETMR